MYETCRRHQFKIARESSRNITGKQFRGGFLKKKKEQQRQKNNNDEIKCFKMFKYDCNEDIIL